MSEEQRAAAIAMSATPGGDGQALTFAAESGAFLDLAHNKNARALQLTLTEHADVVAPRVLDGHINFADGTLRIRVSEIVDLTPSSNVNVSLLELSNTSRHFNHSLRLNGTSVVALDSKTIIVTLTEKQRSKAIAFSATSGGGNSAVLLNVYPGAFRDVATVEVGEFRGVYLTEVADVTGPTLSNARINYGTGTILLDATETIDSSRAFALGGISLINITNSSTGGGLPLSGTTVLGPALNGVGDDFEGVAIRLTEDERILAIRMSNTPGGDGQAPLLNVPSGSFFDIARNPNVAALDLPMIETADTIKPTITLLGLNYKNRVLTFFMSEVIDASSFDFTGMTFTDIYGGNSANVPTSGGDSSLVHAPVPMQVPTVQTFDNIEFNITLSGTQIIEIIEIAELAGKSSLFVQYPVRITIPEGFIRDIAGNRAPAYNMLEVKDPGGTFDEKRIILAQSATGSGNTAPKGYTKLSFQFVGKGIIDGDKAKFVPNNFTTDDDCGVGGEHSVAGMQGADVNAEGELIVRFYGNDVSFNVASPVGEPYKLCYFFTQINSYMIFQAITLEVKDVETLTLDRGEPSSMVVGVGKNVTLDGPGVASGFDTFKFVSHSVTTDAGCNSAANVSISGTIVEHDNLVHVNKGVANLTNASTVTTALTFNEMSPTHSEPFKLCYKFQGEEFKLYSSLTILAKDLSQITANGQGTGSVAVVDVEKNFTFAGTGVAAHDVFFWISHSANRSADCIGTGPHALTSVQSSSKNATTGVFGLSSGSALLTFTNRTMIDKPHRLCYRFGPLEPYKLYTTKTVTVKDIISVVTSIGDPDVAVRRAVKMFSFMGTGISVHDQVLWISGEADRNTNCTASMNATGMDHNKIALVTTDGFYQDSGTVTLAFEEPSPVASLGYKLCFKFGLEPYKLYHDFRVYTKDFSRIVTTEGSSSVALAGADFSKPFAFEGDGLASGDRVKFVSNDVFTDAGCESAVAQGGLSGPDATNGMVLISTAADPDTRVSFTHDLLFSEPSPEGRPFKVCYKFRNEPFKLYENVLLNAKQLSTITANVGSSTTAVVGYGKTFTFGGSGLSSGDTFAFVKDSAAASAATSTEATSISAPPETDTANKLSHATCESILAGNDPNNMAVSMLSQEATQNVMSYSSAGNFIIFGEASGPTSAFRLCYKFTGEKAVLLESKFPFKVLQISNVKVDVGLPTVAVKGVAKTFSFTGADIGSENRAKWVSSSVSSDAGCSGATQVTNTAGNSGEIVVGSTMGVGTAQAIFTTTSLRNDNFQLCFRFGTEPYKLYPSFTLRVKEVTGKDVTSLLVGSPTEVAFLGNYISDWIFGDKYGAGVPDTAKWVAAGDSCSMNPVGGSALQQVVRLPCTTTEACAAIPTGKATFNFSTASPETASYKLCYRFGLEDFAEYSALSIKSLTPQILSASTSSAVVGQTKLLRCVGDQTK